MNCWGDSQIPQLTKQKRINGSGKCQNMTYASSHPKRKPVFPAPKSENLLWTTFCKHSLYDNASLILSQRRFLII